MKLHLQCRYITKQALALRLLLSIGNAGELVFCSASMHPKTCQACIKRKEKRTRNDWIRTSFWCINLGFMFAEQHLQHCGFAGGCVLVLPLLLWSLHHLNCQPQPRHAQLVSLSTNGRLGFCVPTLTAQCKTHESCSSGRATPSLAACPHCCTSCVQRFQMRKWDHAKMWDFHYFTTIGKTRITRFLYSVASWFNILRLQSILIHLIHQMCMLCQDVFSGMILILTTLAGITGPMAQQGFPGQAHQVQHGRTAPGGLVGLQRERCQGVPLRGVHVWGAAEGDAADSLCPRARQRHGNHWTRG